MTWEDDERTSSPLLLGAAALGFGVTMVLVAGTVAIASAVVRRLKPGGE